MTQLLRHLLFICYSMTSFLRSFQSEWLKKRHSASSWLTLIGGIFVPLLILISRLVEFGSLSAANASVHLWESLYGHSWQFMALFLLPMGVVLVTSLITQLEFRNNAWKQLHTTPQRLTTIFFAKLAVIGVLLLQFFLLFNVGIYVAGVAPSLFRGVRYPVAVFPFMAFLKGSGWFFIDCLPIVALQYLISLQSRNFLVPVGVGLGLYVASMISVFWKFGYTNPYGYCAIQFLGKKSKVDPTANIHVWAIGYFVLLTLLGYILYITKKEKG